jgi:F-type H+-transporting ATPase subunit b
MLIAFIVIAIVLGKFGWPVIEGIIDKREAAVKEALEKSEAARVESERLLEEYKKQLEDAKSQSAQIIADAKKTGETAKAEITARAQGEAESMIEKARIAIETEKKAAIAELQGSVADTSIAVASKLIGQDLSDDEHRAIIERYVNEAGSFNAN